jgi:signal transduction histidine kinase
MRAGRTALDEMRRLLSVLRTDDDADGRDPQPGLDAIATLVDDVRRAGLRVELAVPSERPALGPGLELTAYRLVQESLTNVLRHAGASVARVTLGVGSGQLVVRVHDDGRGASGPADSGHGLAGMRERVAMYGGQLEAGPLPEGGYAVEARLPLR